jgi:antitoxin VapB
MDKAKLFTNGRSQAVRLPKEYRFEGSEVTIARMGSAVVLLPEGKAAWDVLFEAADGFTPDFMSEREQPPLEDRNWEAGE